METIDIFYSPITRNYKFKRNGKNADLDIECWQKVNNTTKKDGKNKFLQDLDFSFFDTLYEACHGKIEGESIEINIQSTVEVYEELKKMIEDYNNKIGKSDRNIRIGSLIEMPSNEEVQGFIIEKTKETKSLLENLELDTFDSSVSETLYDHIGKIKELLKLDSSENTISLCVTGVYSTGKSSFINALIGEELLESGSKPTTSSMFSIIKTTQNDPIRIEFTVEKPKPEEISLIYKDKKFITEKELCNQIIETELISMLTSSMSCIEQIHSITKFINEKIKKHSDYLTSQKADNIDYSDLVLDSNVDIFYPFTIGGDVPVKICDTPGTNSSFRHDKKIIEENLSEQQNTILLTLLHPEKSDDVKGHDTLFNIIDEAEQKNCYIDKSRLIFVWTHMDSNYSEKNIIDEKKNDKINVINTNGNIKIINLNDFPIFFMSSLKALAAKKLISNENDEKWSRKYNKAFLDVNLSEECSYGWQTETFKESAQKELAKTENEYEKALIMSGLYSVEKGITDYINKYAGAIISNGLYEKIKEINNDLMREIKSVEEKQKQIADGKVEDFKNKEKQLIDLVERSCKEEKEKVYQRPVELMKKEYTNTIEDYIKQLHKKKYKSSSWKGEKSISEIHIKKTTEILENLIRKDLDSFIEKLFGNYNKGRIKNKEMLFSDITNKLSKEFKEGIGTDNWEKIKKKVLEDIRNNETKELKFENKVNLIFWNKIKSEEFTSKAKNYVTDNTVSILNAIQEYPRDMEAIIDSINKDYRKNLEHYSRSLQELKENKEKEMEKYQKVQELNQEIQKIISQIDEKINPNE